MTRLRKFIVPAVLVASLAGGFAIAQTVMHGRHQMPSPETMQRMQDGQIAGALAALKLSVDQMKLWTPVEQLIRARQAEHIKRMQDHMAAQQDGAATPTPSIAVALPDRLDRMAERMGKNAEQMKAFATTFKPFYASLTDAQKEVVGPLLAHMQRGGNGGGMGWGHGHGKHGGMGDGPGGMMQ